MPFDIAIDFDDAAVTMAARGQTQPYVTPSAIAVRKNNVLSMGEDAMELFGRAPKDIQVVFPLRGGRLTEARWVEEWTRALYTQCGSSLKLRKMGVVFTLPREEMLPALRAAAQACEMTDACCVARDTVLHLGAGADPAADEAVMLAYVGEGGISVSVMCRGTLQIRYELPGGMKDVDGRIITAVRREHGLSIGEVTAKELRSQLAAAHAIEGVSANAVGLDRMCGFPVVRSIPAALGEEAAAPLCGALADMILRAEGELAEEAVSDIMEHGVILAGCGREMPGLAAYITEKTGLKCRTEADTLEKGIMRLVNEDGLDGLAHRM